MLTSTNLRPRFTARPRRGEYGVAWARRDGDRDGAGVWGRSCKLSFPVGHELTVGDDELARCC